MNFLATSKPRFPMRIAFCVFLIASATLLVELLVTRLSSVLFFYHFSFFSISLVMSGLVYGGIIAARWNAGADSEMVFRGRISVCASVFAVGIAVPLFIVVTWMPLGVKPPSVASVTIYSLLFLPGLTAAGTFLALVFSQKRRWINLLYAWDLAGASLACLGTIWALRTLQGPPSFLVPAFMAAASAVILASGPRSRTLGSAVVVGVIALGVLNLASAGKLLRLRQGDNPQTRPIFERWNEHSRVVAFDLNDVMRYFVIDRTAGTLMFRIPPRADGGPIPIDPGWDRGSQYAAYHLGRTVHKSAIIGVGGGSDLLPALRSGAKRVDGYELNRIFVDLLERDFKQFNAITSRPEVHLLHTEARVGIARSGRHYDVIQASMIDTWAATASGGFVLSENGLYTREAWRTFLSHLSGQGVLTLTRWHIPEAPAETLRLVSLAATALEDAGIANGEKHVILVRSNRNDAPVLGANELRSTATILVSKAPFTVEEITRLRAFCDREDSEFLFAPGFAGSNPLFRALLSPATRSKAVRANRFDISAPTDEKPFFFLQIRPSDLITLFRSDFGPVTEITFNGVRILLILCLSALFFVLIITGLVIRMSPGVDLSPEKLRYYRWMIVYFLGIGSGYMLIQLGLHQRLIIIVGHPTLALSIVLFSMLLGTSLGAALSFRLIPSERSSRAGAVILIMLAFLIPLQKFAAYLEGIESDVVRFGLIGLCVASVGCALGLAFPLGVRNIAVAGDRAVQPAWAINGAASIGASALSALLGVSFGTTGVLVAGALAYAVATIAAGFAERSIGRYQGPA